MLSTVTIYTVTFTHSRSKCYSIDNQKSIHFKFICKPYLRIFILNTPNCIIDPLTIVDTADKSHMEA